MYYLGLDVHKHDSYIAVLDEDAKVIEEVRTGIANFDKLVQLYSGSKVAIEATGNHYTIYDTLEEYLEVVVADPNQTKAIGILEAKSDRLDAKLREQLRQTNLIAKSYVVPE